MDKGKPVIYRFTKESLIEQREARIEMILNEMKNLEALLFEDAKKIQEYEKNISTIKKNMDVKKNLYGNLYTEMRKIEKLDDNGNI